MNFVSTLIFLTRTNSGYDMLGKWNPTALNNLLKYDIQNINLVLNYIYDYIPHYVTSQIQNTSQTVTWSLSILAESSYYMEKFSVFEYVKHSFKVVH